MPPKTPDPRRRLWSIAATAVACGLLLGPVDLLAQKTLPYPWANLANSSAVWALAAFAIGAWVGHGRGRAAFAGVLLLLVAVETYYVAATIVQHDDIASVATPSTLIWLLFAVLAGAVFGTAGAWSRSERRWGRVATCALPGAILFAEAAVLATRDAHGDAAFRVDNLQTAAIEVAIGLALTLLIRQPGRDRLASLAVSIPLAAAGFGAFVLAGFGS